MYSVLILEDEKIQRNAIELILKNEAVKNLVSMDFRLS